MASFFYIRDGFWTGAGNATIVSGKLARSVRASEITGQTDNNRYAESSSDGVRIWYFSYGAWVTGKCPMRNNTVSLTIGTTDYGQLSGTARLHQRTGHFKENERYYETGQGRFIGDVTITCAVDSLSGVAGGNATAVCNGHPFVTGDSVTIAGANETDFNGTYTITVVDSNTFTYTFGGGSDATATGTITAAVTD